jgi:hypothetical protein
MNRGDLRTFVRDLTGVISTDVVSDALINRWLEESYAEISRERDWDWLEVTATGTLPAAVDGRHTVNLANGTRRVISAYLVSSAGLVRELQEVSELDHVMEIGDDRYPKYDVTTDGVVTVAPVQPADEEYRIRYSRTHVPFADDTSVPLFLEQFHAGVAYRTAMKVLAFVSDDTDRSDYYFGEYNQMLDGMINMYELSHDSKPLSMGEHGIEERRYYPWFRPS